MNQILTAVLMLISCTAVLLLLGWFVWQRRRNPAVASATPVFEQMKPSRFSRKSHEAEPAIEMMPERLARVSRKHIVDEGVDEDAGAEQAEPNALPDAASDFAPAISPAAPLAPEPGELAAMLETAVAEVENHAAAIESETPAIQVSVHLAPRTPINPGDAVTSWLGGRPRLAGGMEWPRINGEACDFLAQIACADLPDAFYDNGGSCEGWIALFAHPCNDAVHMLHVPTLGDPLEPPQAIDAANGRLAVHGIAAGDKLMRLVRPAFPEWPVDLIIDDGTALAAAPATSLTYDLTDPAFHPFNWDSMLAMVALLEQRLATLTPDEESDEKADADDILATARAMNHDARARAEEIIAIVRETAATEEFSPVAAAAVMDALQAIYWTRLSLGVAGGSRQPQAKILSLTEHHPAADLWVQDYQLIHFDHSKHAYCAHDPALSPATRALYEPMWQDMAAHQIASIRTESGADALTIELPSSDVMNWRFGNNAKLVVTLGKDALAAGEFDTVHAEISY